MKTSTSSKRCGGVGVWGTKRFGRNCWRKWGSGGEPIISEICYESDLAKAERIVADELRRRGWSEAELRERAKGDKGKVVLAGRLRRERTMTLKWVAEHLVMGSWSDINRLAAARKKAR